MAEDFQKQEAKQSLWDLDGTHANKRARNKGKGRNKDKKLIREAVAAITDDTDSELLYQLDKEAEAAMYCHEYGPCENCICRNKDRD